VVLAGGPGRSENGGAPGEFLDDTVFIKGLPETVSEELLAKHFSAVGSVKVADSAIITYSE